MPPPNPSRVRVTHHALAMRLAFPFFFAFKTAAGKLMHPTHGKRESESLEQRFELDETFLSSPNAFRGRSDVEATPEARDRAHDGGAVGTFGKILHKGAIDS